MSIISKLLQNIPRLNQKHLVIGGIFTLALAGSIGLGIATKQHISAAVVRDSGTNSIDYTNANGGAGAADRTELVKDLRDNKPGDLQTIAAKYGLASSEYDRFGSTAVQGTLFRDGHLEVNGQTVMTSSWTMGREKFNSKREAVTVGGKTYYQSATDDSFADGVKSLPVMVMFDKSGVVETAFVNACGNPVTKGNKVTPGATCDAVQATQADKTNKPNTYTFTTKATMKANTTLSRVVYTFSDDNTSVTKTSLTAGVDHTFKKDGKVTIKVYVKVPGNNELEITSVNCRKQITYVPPFYVCTALVATALDQQKRNFRFTVKTSSDKNTTVKSADFTLDSANTTTGVTTKDSKDNIYKEYSFTDTKEHTIVAKVNFNTVDGVKSASCTAKVTPSELPKCTVPGHENLPPNDEQCGYCKQDIPKGDKRCEETPAQPQVLALTATGPEGIVGLFAGTSIFGAIGHRVFTKRRSNRA
jgi:hypothetical protein